MILNGSPKNVWLTLDNIILKIVPSYRYLGATMTPKYVTNLFKDHFQIIAENTKIRAAAIGKLGFSKTGRRVMTSVKLYKLQIKPILIFRAQSIAYAPYSEPLHQLKAGGFAEKLENLNTQLLKTLINCPLSNKSA